MKSIFLLLLATVALRDCSPSDRKIKPEKIIFHTSPCFGACPTYHLEVQSDKGLRLHVERVYQKDKGFSMEPDSTKTGYFTGIVSDTTFQKLLTELETVGLDTLELNGPDCCDGSLKTIIVYYNGKRKFLRSMFPPDNIKGLIAVLYEIAEKSQVRRTDKPFGLEGDAATR